MDDAAGRPRGHVPRPLLAVFLVAVLALVVFVRPDREDDADTPGAADASEAAPADQLGPPAVTPTATPTGLPSDREFCRAYWRMVKRGEEYAALTDGQSYDLFRGAADDLLALGVPQSMSVHALGGFHLVLTAVYRQVGLTLDRYAIRGGFEASELEGVEVAFADHVSDNC